MVLLFFAVSSTVEPALVLESHSIRILMVHMNISVSNSPRPLSVPLNPMCALGSELMVVSNLLFVGHTCWRRSSKAPLLICSCSKAVTLMKFPCEISTLVEDSLSKVWGCCHPCGAIVHGCCVVFCASPHLSQNDTPSTRFCNTCCSWKAGYSRAGFLRTKSENCSLFT